MPVLPPIERLAQANPELVQPRHLKDFCDRFAGSVAQYFKAKEDNYDAGTMYLEGWFTAGQTLSQYLKVCEPDFASGYESGVGGLASTLAKMQHGRVQKDPEFVVGFEDFYHRVAFGILEDRYLREWSPWITRMTSSEDETRPFPRKEI